MSWLPRLIYHALVWKERKRVELVRREGAPAHKDATLQTGHRGETLAYWYLRQAGYIIVARNHRARHNVGELDLIGWDGPVLAFVEVKTRTSLEGGEPEEAVTGLKRKKIIRTARQYLRQNKLDDASYRFDVITLYWEPASGLRLRLSKDAFRPS